MIFGTKFISKNAITVTLENRSKLVKKIKN